jgi:hypothetical protein
LTHAPSFSLWVFCRAPSKSAGGRGGSICQDSFRSVSRDKKESKSLEKILLARVVIAVELCMEGVQYLHMEYPFAIWKNWDIGNNACHVTIMMFQFCLLSF